jgi:molybdopterin synthase sulfur carrier subunit
MPIVVEIPSALREFAGGGYDVRLDGAPPTVAAALDLLWRAHPGLRDRVMNERGEVRTHVNIFVGTENIRFLRGLETPLQDNAELIILPAVSGG